MGKQRSGHVKHIALFLISISFACVLNAQDANDGRSQLSQMLDDRPEMQGIFPNDDVVVSWVIRHFNVGRSGNGVTWGDDEPVNGLAEHIPSMSGEPAAVHVTNRKDVSGRDKWYMLVFELFNELHPDDVSALEKLAATQTVDRVQFANLIINYEYERIVVTNRFFKLYPILGATQKNAPLYFQYMGMMQETLVTEAIPAKTPQPASDFVGHHEHYGQWYDWVRAYGPRRNAEPSRALEHSITGLLQSILSAVAR